MAKKEMKEEDAASAKDMQQRYLELQLYDQQMRQAQQQMQAVEQQTMEIEYVVQCLDEIMNVEAGTELFIPISSGIFLKATLVDSKEALVNVGGGTAVKKQIPEVKELLRAQIHELRRVQEELAAKMEEIARRAAVIESDVRKLTGI